MREGQRGEVGDKVGQGRLVTGSWEFGDRVSEGVGWEQRVRQGRLGTRSKGVSWGQCQRDKAGDRFRGGRLGTGSEGEVW